MSDELIFVDGGSSDGSLEYLRANYSKVYSSAPGRALQMNTGAQHASGNLFIFHHVDNRISIHEFDNIKCTQFDWSYLRLTLSNSNWLYRLIEGAIRMRSRLFHVATGDQVLIFKADFFRELGAYPELSLMEDIAISRLAKKCSKPRALAVSTISSARRWETFGPIKTIFFMWYIQFLFRLGIDTSTLAKLYKSGRWR